MHAICSWCVMSAILFTLLAILGAARVLRIDGDGATGATAGSRRTARTSR